MRLSRLLEDLFPTPPEVDRDIAHLVLDSRKIKKNDLFIAIKGTQLDGRQYISEAIAKGACAVLVDADSSNDSLSWQEKIPLIPIYELQKKLGEIASRFYAYPAKKLRMMGVTGTSGKTSCTHFIAQILNSLHVSCGIIGSLGNGFCGALGDVGLTTPDAISLQATLHDFLRHGAKAVAMEVSSHSIDQGRVNDIEFEMGIFTNLTQDHLDYHGDMQTYAAVKHRFFTELPTKNVIINADDDYGKKWIAEIAELKPVFAYGLRKANFSSPNVFSIYTKQIQSTPNGLKVYVVTPWGEGHLVLPLIGLFNVSNALAVLTCLCLYGMAFKDVLPQFAKLNSVPGRMQMLGGKDMPLIIVDHAHKPDALEKVLQTLRQHIKGKLICVFGCGGDRDHIKRPIMAKIAEKWADQVIVTNDNPRYEQPERIAEQILQGFSNPERVKVMLNRSHAIKNSIQWATINDCVLIAGKGAEHYQQIGDNKIPFDDVEEANTCLKAWLHAASITTLK